MSAEINAARITSEIPVEPAPRRIADRYVLEGLLGKGGMATAYRAFDETTGQRVALKLMSLDASGSKGERDVELFEREYHTLVQLAHPRVVQAFEYGVDLDTPYYTMELLDGGDLQKLAPLRWQDAVVAAHEICSALAMLHSRRLVHRDLTTRNIRRTADGKSKLIDFGLLSPMGPPTLLAGTPPFVPPELVNWVSLDGRSDLFSLGATLYFVLTGRHAFPARRFDQLRDAWRSSPPAPSRLVPGIPTALDAIVLSMLRVDAGSRPKSAAEVMERLTPLLEQAPDDELKAATAHLTTPRLVGRSTVVERFRKRALGAARRKGGGFVVAGEAGLGRSRMLDAFVLEAKLAGALTARAGASNGAVSFGVAATLARQLHASAPATSVMAARANPGIFAALFTHSGQSLAAVPLPADVAHETLVDVTRSELDHGALQLALRTWLLELSKLRPVALAIDDFDEIDEDSAALLASLTWEAPSHAFVFAVSIGTSGAGSSTALDVVGKHAERIDLAPLSPEETTELLESIFGDTANLRRLSQRLHALCGGKPRECMMLAQHLVDRGVITYSGGAFTLPGEIPDGMLPESVETAFAEQVSRASPLARRLAAFLSLELTERLGRSQLVRLHGAPGNAVDAAVAELSSLRLLSGDDTGYTLRERSFVPILVAGFSDDEHTEMHQALAELERSSPLVTAYHRLLGLRPEEGLDLLLSHAQDSDARTVLSTTSVEQLGAARAGVTFLLALAEARRRARPTRDLQAFWVMLAGVGALGEDASYYYDVPGDWLEQLKRETGWYDWQALDPSLDPMTRTMMALGAAAQRYGGASENERVLSPGDAIKQLVGYVVFSIAVAVRVVDLELQASMPALLEPFASLDPMVAAMLDNARGTLLNGLGKRERARELFESVVQKLDVISATLAYADKIRAAIGQTLAEIDASLGVTSSWTARLEQEAPDPHQRVGARYIQKVSALHQGDWEAAEKFRQAAELAVLQSRARPMFSTLGQELEAHAMARDLTGLRQVRSAIARMAVRHTGWMPVRRVADAHYQRLCGDLEAALDAARSAQVTAPGKLRSPWVYQAAAVEAEVLLELGRAAEARNVARAALDECEREGMRHLGRGLSSVLALAEGKLGDVDAATTRLESVIADQTALGVTGLALGRSYEYAARVAIWSLDAPAFERFSALAAGQYRPGKSSVLGALYERLMEEARQAGLGVEASLIPLSHVDTGIGNSSRESVTSAMAECMDRHTRARRALSLLCDGDPPHRGHLFLVGEAGLELVASNDEVTDAPALLTFAQGRLEAEVDTEHMVTAAFETAAEPSAALSWQAPDGESFTTALLITQQGSAMVIAGLLVLSDRGTRRRDFDDLMAAVARAVIESGDAHGRRAG
ncbi:MAG TPA: serine/threonine-protein kinase [Polyangiaceae bacterium]|jgi:hypothetical protein|nr:serine/threonine-protein kinase [Polyangiaceae bacterium]